MARSDAALPVLVDDDGAQPASRSSGCPTSGTCGLRRRARTTTSRSSAPARRASPPRCTRPPTASRRSCWSATCPAARPGTPRGSRTSSASRAASAARSSRGSRVARRRGSERSWCFAGSWAATASRTADTGSRWTEAIEVTAPIALAAPGMDWRRLDVDGVEELLDRSVYYGAGRSEAAQCGDEDVIVVGAGNSAGQSVLNLANAGARVKMVVRGDRLAKTHVRLPRRSHRAAPADRRPPGHPGTRAARRRAASKPSRSRDPRRSGAPAGEALFICIGGQPRTGWAADAGVDLDRAGYILTGPDLLEQGRAAPGWPLDRDPLALETSVPGHVRRRRRAPWIDEAGRGRRRRGRDGRGARAPAAGGAGR